MLFSLLIMVVATIAWLACYLGISTAAALDTALGIGLRILTSNTTTCEPVRIPNRDSKTNQMPGTYG